MCILKKLFQDRKQDDFRLYKLVNLIINDANFTRCI